MFFKNEILCILFIGVFILACSRSEKKDSVAQRAFTYTAKKVLPDSLAPPLVSTLKKSSQQALGSPTVYRKIDKSVALGSGTSVKLERSHHTVLTPDAQNYPKSHKITSQPLRPNPPQITEATTTWRGTLGHAEYFTEKDGFPLTNVGGIFQDNDGAIWACSRVDGAVKYDGYNFYQYNQHSGLADISMVNMFFDSQGDIWFGMSTALAKFDGSHFTTYTGENEISNVKPTKFAEDLQGNIWIGSSEGLYKIDKMADKITHFTTDNGLLQNNISGLQTDRHGQIWITYNFVGISILSEGEQENPSRYTFSHYPTDENFTLGYVQCLYEDSKGQMFIGSDAALISLNNDNSNLASFDVQHYDFKQLKIGFIYDIEEDKQGRIWVVNGYGIAQISFTTFGLPHRIAYLDFEDYGLPSNQTFSINKDKNNNIWLGHAGTQISKINFNQPATYIFRDFGLNIAVNDIREDSDQNIWMATEWNGLLCLTKDTNTNEEVVLEYTTAHGLNGHRSYSMELDGDGNIWLSHYEVLSKLIFPNGPWSGTIVDYETDLIIHRINDLMIDDQGHLWICETSNDLYDKIIPTKSTGILKWDGKKIIKYGKAQGLIGEDALSIVQDEQGKYWIMSAYVGMSLYDPGANVEWQHFPTGSLVPEHFAFCRGHKEGVWLSGNDSLLHYTLLEDNIYNVELIPPKDIRDISERRSIIEYKDQHLLVGNRSGLEHINTIYQDDAKSVSVQKITGRDGLQVSSIKLFRQTSGGKIWAAGHSGLVSLHPEKLELNIEDKEIIYARMYLNDQEIYDGRAMNLTFEENDLSFEVNIVEVNHPHRVYYRHRLKGVESNWSRPTNQTKISYPNLPHGNYELLVQAKIGEENWSKTFGQKFKIYPPWWFTYWAYCLYGLILGGIIYALWKMQLNRIHQKNLIEKEKLKAENLEQIDKVKTQFFTNLSHEYRTPLTVILGMAEEIESPHSAKKLIKQSGQNLLRLVNQMLDFSKFEAGQLRLNVKNGEVVSFIRYMLESFQSLAEHKKITLDFHSEMEHLKTEFDEDKLQHIVMNLLSNAIKFTPIGGQVSLSLKDKNGQLLIQVEDSGIGIASDKLDLIFERYYQVHGTLSQGEPGTGIGLSFTKDLVALMHGRIEVESMPNIGSTFNVLLPLLVGSEWKEAAPSKLSDWVVPPGEVVEERLEIPVGIQDKNEEATEKPRLLIIEDNPEVVNYMQHILVSDYEIAVAEDGKIGIDKAVEWIPDIIISDVMMPFKDGYEVTDFLKNDERTSHIPIILLTAKADAESRLKGLKRKADNYLSKPFDKIELKVILNNLIELRKKLQVRYAHFEAAHGNAIISNGLSNGVSNGVSEINYEDAFVTRVNEIIKEQYINPGFLVDELTKEVGMSRSQLNRKLKALTGKTTVAYLRSFRLQKARNLLIAKKGNVSEIAYQVGFADPSYFTRVFAKEYGERPTEILTEN